MSDEGTFSDAWFSAPFEGADTSDKPDARGTVRGDGTLSDTDVSELLGDAFAGVWREGATLHVAVVRDVERARAEVARVGGGEDLVVTLAEHSHAQLWELVDAVREHAARLGARLSSVGVDDRSNRVEASLVDLDTAESQALRRAFSSSPVEWSQLRIVFGS